VKSFLEMFSFSRYLFENLPKSMQGGFLRVINFLTGSSRLEMFFEVITINFVGFCFGFNLLVALVLSNSKMITFCVSPVQKYNFWYF